jgi:hypothetical protein
MTTTTDNWLASNNEQINTKATSDTTATPIEYVDVSAVTPKTTTNDIPPNAPTGINATVKATEATTNAPDTEGSIVLNPVVILNPSGEEIPEVFPTLSLGEIRQILIDKDYEQLHNYLENETLIVLPKAQLELLMSKMRDHMTMMRGLDMIANLVKPLVEESVEGKALTKFLVDNADIFSGKEFGMVQLMKLAPGLITVLKHGKSLISKIDVNLLKENADFLDDFKGVLRRSDSPFIEIIGAFGNGVTNVKKLNA